ncbi:MAG: OmpA family protein [Flavobacteriales bacterium]|nr:OmpA family protein [Flavobacteriales bacterium]
MKTIYTSIFSLFFFAALSLKAQNVEFKSANFKDKKEEFKAAVDNIDKGDDFLKKGNELVLNTQDPGDNFLMAIFHYSKAQAFNPNNAELNFKLGMAYFYTNMKYKSKDHILKAVQLDPEVDKRKDFFLGVVNLMEMKFDDATKYFKSFEDSRKAEDYIKFIAKYLEECKSGKVLVAKPERVWVDNIAELNSEYDDYSPSITMDGSTIIFTSRRPNGHTALPHGGYDSDIYTAEFSGGKWSAPKSIGSQINTDKDETSSMLAYNGTKLLLFRNENGNFDIMESELRGAAWSAAVSFARAINTVANQTFSSYDFDDVKLYYLSDKEGGISNSGTDIYFSGVMDRAKRIYGNGMSVGSVINTRFNEGPLYMHPDGETMYFASQGHNSMGGYDIFVSYKKQGQWTAPINMGYPINTPYDDFICAMAANGKHMYMASNRPGGKGGLDLYKVTFWGPEKKLIVDNQDYLLSSVASPIQDNVIEASVQVQKKSLTVFKGRTIDAITKKPVEADIDIVDNGTGQVISTFKTNSATGKFLLSLNSGKNYGIAVKANGYLFHSENFDIPLYTDYNLVDKEIELKNIAVGSKIALRNIFFATGLATLTKESNAELDRLVKLLKDVPKLKIEISGHTDNVGSESMNQKLSEDRAKSVVDYLVSKGIDKGRLTAKGYGSTRPVATNNSAEGRQQNRRTEFEILAN